MIEILSLALIPVIVFLVYIYLKDRKHPEPIGMLLKAFFFGIISCVLALFITAFQAEGADNGISGVYDAFVGAALPEEFAKLLMLWLCVRKSKDFDEPIDGIVYAVFVSLGFAALENVLYIYGDEDLYTIAIQRGLFSIPGHFCFGVCMGYFYSLAHFGNKHKILYYLLAYIFPVLLHGLYDGLIAMMSENDTIIYFIWLAFCIFTFRHAIKRIEKVKHIVTETESTEA